MKTLLDQAFLCRPQDDWMTGKGKVVNIIFLKSKVYAVNVAAIWKSIDEPNGILETANDADVISMLLSRSQGMKTPNP